MADVFARLAAGDMDAHGVCENVTKDGRTITCEWHNTPLLGTDGTFQGVLSLAQDVTARREAEQALILRDRAIRAVVGGIVITDATPPDNPISYVSHGFEHLTGYTGAEAVGRNCRFLQGKETDPATVAEVREAVREGLPCDVELLNYRKDGTPFWNALSLSPVRDEEGRLTNFIGVQTDVTGRRKLEDQFHQAQKMEAVGQLAGGVAHDFNNLLTVINGYGEIVHDALPPGHPSRELVEEITKAGERAAGLTRQLLAFSRQSVLEPKVLDPNALVRDVERMLRRLIGEDVDLATRLAPDVGWVKADPGQLEQAVVNLCVNARDAMPTGGQADRRDAERRPRRGLRRHPPGRAARPLRHARRVSDTGTGMTPEVQARIFEPFFTTKEAGQGDRAGAGDGVRVRQAVRRARRGPQRGGPGDDVQAVPPAGRGSPAGRQVGSPPDAHAEGHGDGPAGGGRGRGACPGPARPRACAGTPCWRPGTGGRRSRRRTGTPGRSTCW